MRIEQVSDKTFALGEGPLWDVDEQALYFVDVEGKTLWRLHPESGALRSWAMPMRVSSLALRASGGAVVTLADGFYALDLDSGATDRIGPAIVTERGMRFNDGKVDRQGRYLAGTMDYGMREAKGSLHRLNADLSVETLESEVICSNGPCFSPDGRTFYFTDTMRYAISAYDYAPDTGAITNKRTFAELPALGLQGGPDGCTVDAEGYVWGAVCMAGVVARYAPDGTLDRRIEMPVSYVSSVMFGGPNLDVLYVTTIGGALMGREAEEPNAGALFAIEGLGVEGLPEPRFAG